MPPDIERFGPARLPLEIGGTTTTFDLTLWHVGTDRWVEAAVGPERPARPVVRIESACLFGHVFRSAQCDCGFQWRTALAQIAEAGGGLLLYGVDQDARGLGLEAHFEIYRLRQQEGYDTDEVYRHIDAPVDARDYEAVATLLRHLEISAFTLLTNNLHRIEFFRDRGFDIEARPLVAPLTVHNMSTLMIEKEDLRYRWEFSTHGDHLGPLQAAVLDRPDHRELLILDEDQTPVHRGTDGGSWAFDLPAAGTFTGLTVAYLTDLPRVDELVRLAATGVAVVVIPIKRIPRWLRHVGEAHGVKVVDWAREHAFVTPRPQWELERWSTSLHRYRRGDHARLVDVGGAVGSNPGWREVGVHDLNVARDGTELATDLQVLTSRSDHDGS